jgi:cytosine/uracil/thiamine/allantoin permease
MKKLLLVVGIITIVACILFVIFALLNMHAYYNLFDGTAGHYSRLHQRMIISFAVGIVFAVIAAACFIIRSKI